MPIFDLSNFISGLSLVGFSIGFFSSIILFSHARRMNAGYYLATLILIFSGIEGYAYLMRSGNMVHVPHVLRTYIPLMYLGGPFVYFFVRKSIKPDTVFQKKDLLHFIPFILTIINLLPFYMQSAEVKVQVIDAIRKGNGSPNLIAKGFLPGWIANSFRIGHFAVYIVLSYTFLQKNRAVWKDSKDKAVKSLVQFVNVILGLKGLSVLSSITVLIIESFSKAYFFWPGGVLNSSLTIVSSLFVFIRPEIIFGSFIYRIAKPNPSEQEKIFKENGEGKLSKQDQHKMDSLLQYIHNEKPFLNPDADLESFSLATGIPGRKLTTLIKEAYGTNFAQFVNSYRIKHFIELVDKDVDRRFTRQALIEQSGFMHRSTFYAAFRQTKGVSPSEYLDEHFQENKE